VLAEADAAHPEFPQVTARTPAQLAAIMLADFELRRPLCRDHQACFCHILILLP
jgi:hypothetical protein